MNEPSTLITKVWNYAHVLKNAEVGYGDYVEQITYLLFLKLVDEMTELGYDPPLLKLRRAGHPIPYAWSELSNRNRNDPEVELNRQITRSYQLQNDTLSSVLTGQI